MFRIIIVLELFYLALFNSVLNLDFSQDLINRIKPDKFKVSWERAWTPYPFRLYAYGVATNGPLRSQQWLFKSDRVSGSISLFPLISKTISLNRIRAQNITYHQYPRPQADRDFSAVREYFPPRPGRELETSSTPMQAVKADKKPWHINISDLYASGEHSLWLYQAQASISGDARMDLSAITHGGPVSLSNGEIDLKLDSLLLNDDREIIRDGLIRGSIALHPLIATQTRGLDALTFLEADLELKAHTENLSLLNIYLKAFEDMRMNGAGVVQGNLKLKHGQLLPDSQLKVAAHSLSLDLLDYHVEGDGNIHVETPTPTSGAAPVTRFAIAFNDLEAYYDNASTPLLVGNGLILNGSSSNTLIPTEENPLQAKSLAISISALEAPDLSSFQHFLPDNWTFRLYGGKGEVLGKIEIDQGSFFSDVRLKSRAADIGFKDLRFISNLDMGLSVKSPELATGRFELAGTHIKINETEASNNGQLSEPWHAAITVEKGTADLNLDQYETDQTGAQHFAQLLREKEIGALLASSDGDLIIKGEISDLGWLNVLMPNPYDLRIYGSGGIISEIRIRTGEFGQGSKLRVSPQEIGIEVLDYYANGEGDISVEVTEGGATPDLILDVQISDGKLKRIQEQEVFVGEVEMHLQALVRDIDPGKVSEEMELRLQIPSARVDDMTAYNSYLPEQSPLQITGGGASLTADIELKPMAAAGYVRLQSHDLGALVDGQRISAALIMDIQLAGGHPREMNFDISGSTIKLDEVKVVGDQSSFREDDWATEILFTNANAVWKKPVQLDVEADISMTDSIPIVSMLANKRGKHGWLENALTVDDVAGYFKLHIANQKIVIPYAYASSDNIDVGAKAIISEESRNGRVFVRYKALKALLKIDDGKRNIDILKARKKFDAYSINEIIREKGL